jgi:hypothetical protein
MLAPVTPSTREKLPPWEKARLAAEILLGYARVRWLLRSEDAVSAMARLRAGCDTAVEPPAGVAARITGLRLAHAVIKTLTPVPADSRCLFRSLVLTVLLERRRIDSALILAVRPEPFAAHAWVELEGRPLLPPAEDGFERLAVL